MDLRSISRKVLVLVAAALLLVGFAPGAKAAISEVKLTLIGDEEASGSPGNGMVSIGDTIEVRVIPTPAESVVYIIADLRKYGGSEAETLHAFTGAPAYLTPALWVPTCSENGYAAVESLSIVYPDSPFVHTESWRVYADTATAGAWLIKGSLSGLLPDTAWTDSLCEIVDASGNPLFRIKITDTLNICCNNIINGDSDCDHFTFNTYAMIPPDSIWLDTLIVHDAGIYWIDNTPCPYEGHDDPSVLVQAAFEDGHIDSAIIDWPRTPGGDSLDFDTHHTTYAILSDPSGTGAEFLEYDDYWYRAITDKSGLGPMFGLEDNILNPQTYPWHDPDTLKVILNMMRLSHENGNDDIYYICWDADILGTDYGDPSNPNVGPDGWLYYGNPFYPGVTCAPPDNGVTDTLEVAFPILDGTTDTGPGQKVPMKWISDSGDTTYFVTLTNAIDAAIDNKVPKYKVPTSPTDSVTADDIRFVADMDNAGNVAVLNPASEGNPTPDQLRVRIDLAGLYDLSDVTGGGYAFANMSWIGFNQATGIRPLNQDFWVPMSPASPIWQTNWVDVLASPPSPYAHDDDHIVTSVWIFDNAGNWFSPGLKDSSLYVDNILPYVDPDSCAMLNVIYAEIKEDVAGYTGYANVGEPFNNICDYNGNGDPLDDYNMRDKIVLHANLGDYLGADEVADVVLINDPFCVGGITLYDDGTLGDDPVMGDKNYTGHARVEVGNSLFCHLDTDEDQALFEVKVADNAGNVATIPACIGIKYDNEIPTITAGNVSIYFWDDPETFGVDGDVNGDGIVNVGDKIIFEWRAQDEVWDDTEIDSVKVLASSIDSTYTGTIMLYWNPSGGMYRNHWPDGPGSPYEIEYGSVDGQTLCASFCVWDNAGNSTGWKKFCSDLILDNYEPIIDCADIEIDISGADAMASIGDTITFTYTGDIDDIESIVIDVSDISSVGTIELNAENEWSAWVVVEPGDLNEIDDYSFDVIAYDDVGNEFECGTQEISIDNLAPDLSCGYAYVRLWDYNDNVTHPTRVVNVGDNLTATYFDRYGDVETVTADFSNYGLGVVNLVFGFDGGPEYKWGYRIDPVPEGNIDQGPGGQGTKVKIRAVDAAGNVSEAWVCPIWFNESIVPDPIANPGDTTYSCNAGCVAVDIIPPGPPDPSAITFQLLETSNQVANVGDRLRIIVNMGDPTQPGYDMNWQTAFIEADVSQYGYGGYIRLTDNAWSTGGEGDGQFSYFFFYNADDGYEFVEGLPILPGSLDVPAGSPLTKIRVRSYDNAGNWSGWVESDVLRDALTNNPVPVDNEIPEIDPDWMSVSFVDVDENGILDIGDIVTVSVDMTNAPGNEIAGVWAYLYDWGYPTKGMVPLEASSPVYTKTFVVQQNEGEFCDGELFENEWCGIGFNGIPHPELKVVAKDINDNWSDYDNASAPSNASNVPFQGETNPKLNSWPFVYDWTESGSLTDIVADTDAPDPVNRDYRDIFSYKLSDVAAYQLPDGRIGLKIFYKKVVGGTPRNIDVQRFYVYGDINTPGEIDWTTFLGEPIPAGSVPENGFNNTYQWVSDVLPEREEPYRFAVLAVDDAGNMSDPALTWITNTYADTTRFTGYVQAFNTANEPISVGNRFAKFRGYLHSEYWQVPYVEWYARVKDLDPLTEGDQPSEWRMFAEQGQWPSDQPVEPPYSATANALANAFDDILSTYGICQTFEIVIVPWDMAGNHISLDEAAEYAFDFVYDSWEPVITTIEVSGTPFVGGMVVSNKQPLTIYATGTDMCGSTTELTWELRVIEIGGENVGGFDGILIDRQVLPIGAAYNYQWDITNYPAGDLRFRFQVADNAGNIDFEDCTVTVIDEVAPTGYFAFGSWPYPRIYDGYHLRASDPTDCVNLYFVVEWDGSSMDGYDVAQVAVDYKLGSGGWSPIATVTNYLKVGNYYYYYFCFNTSGFNDGDIITLRATVMDVIGNTSEATVTMRIAKGYPVLTLSIPDAKEVCEETAVSGMVNLVATDNNNPTSTYDVTWMYKRHDEPDIGDCSPWGRWSILPIDSFEQTQETIWRAVVDTRQLDDGLYDIVVATEDIAGNRSWDKDHDNCVDPGMFADALANGMGMTVRVQNSAPEVRIRQVNQFTPTDQVNFVWTMPVYIKCNETVTAKVWTESTCDVERVEYWLIGEYVNGTDEARLVAVSTDAENNYEVTFPETGSICDYLLPGALTDGNEIVLLVARLIDKLGNISTHEIIMMLLDQEAACAFITSPAPNSYIRGAVELNADAIDDDEVYDITYEYRAAGSEDWITIATTKPWCGDPWNKDIDNQAIYWVTDLLADGRYELRAVPRDANLAVCGTPQVIKVTVDNTVPVVESFDMAPKYVTEAALPDMPTVWIGGSYVELFTTASDNNGINYVNFYYKPVETHFEDRTYIATDYDAPFAYMWNDTSFTNRLSGWYDIIVEVVDLAGNVTWYTETVYIEHCEPYAEIIQINNDETPNGSRFFGVININAYAEDSGRMVDCRFINQEWHCGLASLQFQYAIVGGYDGWSEQTLFWYDLGELLVGSGPNYSLKWDTSFLIGKTVYIRAKVKDNVGNIGYSNPVMIEIIDKVAPKAVIAGVDPTFSYVWAVAETHGQFEYLTVRFEYKPAGEAFETSPWTVIGEVSEAYSPEVYGVPWHVGPLAEGNYWVRAVAYDDDYDPEDPDFADLYDHDPAMMLVTIANGKVTMASTEAITELSLLGNLEDCEDIMVKAVCQDKPTIIAVFDDDPEDHFNEPYVDRLLMLERPDDPTCWVDHFSLYDLDPWGNAFIIATHNDGGIVGAVTKEFKLFKVTTNEGTKGVVSQFGLAIDIPAGAVHFSQDGLIIVPVPQLIEEASVEPTLTIGDPIMVTFMNYNCGEKYWFENGNRATVTITYDENDIPEGVSEDDLLVGRWSEYHEGWAFYALQNFIVDTEANTITFTTECTGTFSVVASTTFRIDNFVYVPRCGDYTGIYPTLCMVIEDLLTGIDEDEIKVVLNGPAEDKIFNDVIIYYGEVAGPYAGYLDADYDDVSHVLCIKVLEGGYYPQSEGLLGAIAGWDGKGLPGGTYTLDVYAMNKAGVVKHNQFTFKVDRTAPVVDYKGEYVAPNPSFEIKVTDSESGIVCDSMFLDVFSVKPCPNCDYNVEEYLGTLTPISCDTDKGTIKFGNVIFNTTLGHEMAIDVVLYDGHYTDAYCDYGDCRQYEINHGVPDCAGNHAAPIWRRYIVDAEAPIMTVVSPSSARTIKIQVTDNTSGINTTGFVVSGLTSEEYTSKWTTTKKIGDRIVEGFFEITPTKVADISVSGVDMVGNLAMIEVKKADEAGPTVEFVGTYVAPNPWFTVKVTDPSGIVCDRIFLDVFSVKPCVGCETDLREYLGTLSPISCNEETGIVKFGDMTFHTTLAHEMAIDVVVYGGTYTIGPCGYDDCRQYGVADGVPDRLGNHAAPVWRRFVVDAEPPVLTVISEPGAKTLRIQVVDNTSGINTSGFVITGVTSEDYTSTWVTTKKVGDRVVEGILAITLNKPANILVTAADMVGNLASIEIQQGTTELVDVIDVVNYPNPFDPSNGECATIEYTLTKGAQVSIVIYDFSGEKVQTVYEGYRGPGTYLDKWCGYNGSGKLVASGAYIGFIKVDDGTKVVTKNLKIGVYKKEN